MDNAYRDSVDKIRRIAERVEKLQPGLKEAFETLEDFASEAQEITAFSMMLEVIMLDLFEELKNLKQK